MGTITERLQWIIDANADQAVSAFKKTGDAADKELGKAETKLDKVGGNLTKFGAGATAAAGVAGAALFKTATSFEDLGLASDKFSQTTGTSVEQASRWIEVTGDMGVSSETLESSMNKMNKTLGASPEVFAKYGVAIKQTADGNVDVEGTFLNVVDKLDAIPNASDRAAAATALLGKGWTGMSQLIGEGSASLVESLAAVSDAKVIDPSEAQTAKDFRDSLDRLKDSGEDLALSIGKGAAPVIGGLATTIGAAVEKLGALNSVSDGTVGKLAAIGTIGLGTVGSLSLVAGQVIKMRDRFTSAEGAMTGFGKAATGVGIALGLIAAQQVIFATIDQIRGVHDLTDEYNAFLNATAKKPDTLSVLSAFDDLTKQVGDNISTMEAGKRDLDEVFSGGEQNTWAKDTQTAFENVKATSLDAADQIVTAYEAILASAQAGNQSAIDGLRARGLDAESIAAWRKEIDDAKGAQDRATESTDAAAVATDAAKESTDKYTAALEGVKKAHEDDLEAQNDLINAQRAAADAGFAVTQSTNDYHDSVASLSQRVKDAKGDQDKIKQAYDDTTSSAESLADATVRQYEEQTTANRATLTATQKVDLWNGSMLNAAAAARGPLRTAILDHIAAVNGIPPDKLTTISAETDPLDIATVNNELNTTSVTRTAAFKADADNAALAQTNADLDRVGHDRTVTFHAGSTKIYDSGGVVGTGGGLAAEKRPEFATIAGQRVLLTSPTMVPAGTKVTGGAETERILGQQWDVPGGGLVGGGGGDGVTLIVQGSINGDAHLMSVINDALRQVGAIVQAGKR